MIIISTNPKNQLLQKVKEELDFLGKNYEVKNHGRMNSSNNVLSIILNFVLGII
nr:MAG TPA: hypothetical protein [Caudoviricetes sp.]